MARSGPQTELLERTPEKKQAPNRAPKTALRPFVSVPCSSDLASCSTPCHRFSSKGEKFWLLLARKDEGPGAVGDRKVRSWLFEISSREELHHRRHIRVGSPWSMLSCKSIPAERCGIRLFVKPYCAAPTFGRHMLKRRSTLAKSSIPTIPVMANMRTPTKTLSV